MARLKVEETDIHGVREVYEFLFWEKTFTFHLVSYKRFKRSQYEDMTHQNKAWLSDGEWNQLPDSINTLPKPEKIPMPIARKLRKMIGVTHKPIIRPQ